MKTYVRKWPLAAVCGVVLAASISATTRAQEQDLHEISFWYQETVFGAPLMVALEKGWYQAELANVGYRLTEHTAFAGPPIIEALAAREADIAELGTALAVNAQARGIPMKLVATTNIAGESIMVRSDSSIDEITDLKGKTIAIHGRATMQDFVVRKALQDAGLNPSEAAEYIEMKPTDQATALVRGDIDAAVLWEPHTAKLQVAGKGRVLKFGQEVWPDHDNMSIGVTTELAENHGEAVRVFNEQTWRALQYMREHPEESQQIVAKRLGLDMAVVKQSWKNITRPTKSMAPNAESINTFAGALYDWGYIERDVDASELIDTSFLPE